MILVTVSSESPETGGIALKAVTDRVPDILTELQAGLGLRPKALISSTPVVMDVEPEVVHKKQIRAALLAGAGVFGLGLLTIGLIDAMLQRRGRPAGEDEVVADDDPEEDLAEEESPDWAWTDGAGEPGADGDQSHGDAGNRAAGAVKAVTSR